MRSDLLPVLRQSILAAKPRTPKPLGAPLKLEHGWLLPYLLAAEGELWGRWEHWHDTMLAGRVIGSIPLINWESHSTARRMVETSLTSITTHGSWQGWGSWQVAVCAVAGQAVPVPRPTTGQRCRQPSHQRFHHPAGVPRTVGHDRTRRR